MPKYLCDTCPNECVMTVTYTTVKCLKCNGTMRPVGAGLPVPQPIVGVNPLPKPPTSIVGGGPLASLPKLPPPPPPLTLVGGGPLASKLPPPPPPLTLTKPASQPSVASATPVTPPAINMSELRLRAVAKKEAREVNATVSKNLVFTMTDSGNTWPFDYPIKYRIWVSDKAKQSAEITVEIPIKVHSDAEALNYWKSKGYAEADFYKTVHGGKKPGVIGATATDDVKKKWSQKINKAWGKVGVIWVKPSNEVLSYSLRFQFNYVDDIGKAAAGVACVKTTGEAAGVNPTGTIDAVRWGVDDIDENTLGPICHEVGHLIGNPDEYFTITYDGKTKAWGPGYQTTAGTGIMNNPDRAPLIRYYKHLALELINAFSIPAAEAAVVEDIAMASTSKRHKLTDHIWS